MIYNVYEAQRRFWEPARAMAGWTIEMLRSSDRGNIVTLPIAASLEMFEANSLTHLRPDWRIEDVLIDGAHVEIVEEITLDTPFCNLLHFRKTTDVVQPKVLLVAPISGHFATLLRPTVQRLLADHDVYITDWKNARDQPRSAGRFDVDDNIALIMDFMRTIGPGGHLFAVCQPSPAAVAATALMAEDGDPAVPATLTLMAGPIDARVNPSSINVFATDHSLSWFERNLVVTAPIGTKGHGRRVYPGASQISAFMMMNLERHVSSQLDWMGDLKVGLFDKAAPKRAFYDEYYAVSDLPAEFFLDTVDRIFQRYQLPKGELEWRGRRIDPGQIRNTPLLTIEGALDDICPRGQTAAAHDLLTGLPDWMKHSYVQDGAGHYGVFSGRHWRERIYPLYRDFVAASGDVHAEQPTANAA